MRINAVNPTLNGSQRETQVVSGVQRVGRHLEQDVLSSLSPRGEGNEVLGQKQEFELEPDVVRQALEEVNENINLINRRMEFRVHKSTNRIMVKVVDKETDEVIKEIPPEKLLDMAAKLQELVGLLVDKQA